MKLRWNRINGGKLFPIWQAEYRTCYITADEGRFFVNEYSIMSMSLQQAIYLIDHKAEIALRKRRA